MPGRVASNSFRLESALRTVRSVGEVPASLMLVAAETLVANGRYEEAELALRRSEVLLQQSGVRSSSGEALRRVNRRLHESGAARRSSQLGDLSARLLSSDEGAVLCVAPRARSFLVVFPSMYGDFWISLPVLHCLLPSATTTILYLKDPATMMFLSGLSHFGGGFDGLCSGIRALAAEHAIDDIRVMGFSAGGYGALLAASRIGASSYLGFSIRTDLSPLSELPKDRYVERPDLHAAVGDLLIDLKPLLERGEYPRRGILYYGAKSRIDEAHARHFAGVRNFVVNRLVDSHHNTILNLLAEGKFEGVIRRFLS